MSFTEQIRPHVNSEIAAAQQARTAGDTHAEFSHLERAHVLGQASTVQHVRVHVLMLAWSVRNRRPKEFVGQVLRIVGAATRTAAGLVPRGNPGGANISPFKPLPVPPDLDAVLRRARGDA